MLVGFVIYYEISGRSQPQQPAQKIPFLWLFEVLVPSLWQWHCYLSSSWTAPWNSQVEILKLKMNSEDGKYFFNSFFKKTSRVILRLFFFVLGRFRFDWDNVTSHLEVYYSSAEPQQYYFSKCFPGNGLCVVLVAVGTVKCSAGQTLQLNREYRGCLQQSAELHCQFTALLHGVFMNVQHTGVLGLCHISCRFWEGALKYMNVSVININHSSQERK